MNEVSHQHGGSRGSRPGSLASIRGSVTIELSGALVALTMCFMMLMPMFGLVSAQLALTSLARDAARAASMEVDPGSAESAVQRVLSDAPGVHHAIDSDGAFVTVNLHRDVRILRLPAAVTVRARSTALEEVPW